MSKYQHTCPRCQAQVSTDLQRAQVYHRCPNVRGNLLTQFQADNR